MLGTLVQGRIGQIWPTEFFVLYPLTYKLKIQHLQP